MVRLMARNQMIMLYIHSYLHSNMVRLMVSEVDKRIIALRNLHSNMVRLMAENASTNLSINLVFTFQYG